LAAAGRHLDAIPLSRESTRQHLTIALVVIDNEDRAALARRGGSIRLDAERVSRWFCCAALGRRRSNTLPDQCQQVPRRQGNPLQIWQEILGPSLDSFLFKIFAGRNNLV
jgi:hypothetical protein